MNFNYSRLTTFLLMAVFSLLLSPTSQAQNDSTQTHALEQILMQDSAEQAVEGATMQVLALIKEGQSYASQDEERFYREVEALVRPMIDFKRFARNVMGPSYRTATEEQRMRFSESFKWGLVRSYALALTEFHNGKVEVLPPRRPSSNPKKAKVVQEITFEGKTYVVVYLMQRNKKNVWRVQNIIIEGVNLGLNYKNQFAKEVRRKEYQGDLDKVIDAWTKFVNKEANAAKAEAPSA